MFISFLFLQWFPCQLQQLYRATSCLDMRPCLAPEEENGMHLSSILKLFWFYVELWQMFVSPLDWAIMPPLCTSSAAQGGGRSFQNRKPIGEVGCCESRMAEQIHCFATFLPFREPGSSFFWLLLFADLLSSSLLCSPPLLFICPYCQKFDF